MTCCSTAIRTRLPVVLISLTLLLCACGGDIIIRDDFPDPLVEPVPYRVGVLFSPQFRNYVYSNEDSNVSFELGSKQTALYQTVFNAMFAETVAVTDVEAETMDGSLDLVLEPVLEEYAFLAPAETATDFFAVSLKYQIRLYSGDGELIGYWPFVAYGKNRSQLLNKNESLGDATSRALRDAAAALVSQFRNVVLNEAWKPPQEAKG